MRYAMVSVLIMVAGACGDEAQPHINVSGTFVAESFDGAPGPLESALHTVDAQGQATDTIAVFAVTDFRFDFLDQNPNPDDWDNAAQAQVTTCVRGSIDFDCEAWEPGGQQQWSLQHAYRATVDSLIIRTPDLGPEPWARVQWIGDQAAFELEWSFQADTPVLVRFVRQ